MRIPARFGVAAATLLGAVAMSTAAIGGVQSFTTRDSINTCTQLFTKVNGELGLSLGATVNSEIVINVIAVGATGSDGGQTAEIVGISTNGKQVNWRDVTEDPYTASPGFDVVMTVTNRRKKIFVHTPAAFEGFNHGDAENWGSLESVMFCSQIAPSQSGGPLCNLDDVAVKAMCDAADANLAQFGAEWVGVTGIHTIEVTNVLNGFKQSCACENVELTTCKAGAIVGGDTVPGPDQCNPDMGEVCCNISPQCDTDPLSDCPPLTVRSVTGITTHTLTGGSCCDSATVTSLGATGATNTTSCVNQAIIDAFFGGVCPPGTSFVAD